MRDGAVVVGVDGSEPGMAAVRAGAWEASARGLSAHLVHAGDEPATDLMAAAAVAASAVAPGVPVTSEACTGGAAALLLDLAARASLVVTGHRGRGGFGGLRLGSVATQVAAYSPVPVVVVKDEAVDEGPVVVGVDGSETSDRAIGFAFEEAALRKTDLVAVLAWQYPMRTGDILPIVYDDDEISEEEGQRLAARIDEWCARHPEVPVTRHLRRGRPAKILVDESKGAALLVVGSRGRGGFEGLVLGSVSQAMLGHAPCPVAVVRP